MTFKAVHLIQSISTRAHGTRNPPEYVTLFHVQYKIEGHLTYTDVQYPDGQQWVFDGNDEGSHPSSNHLTVNIEAAAVKIIPVAWIRSVSMQVDVFGCYIRGIATVTNNPFLNSCSARNSRTNYVRI